MTKRLSARKYRYILLFFGWTAIIGGSACFAAHFKQQGITAEIQKYGVTTKATITNTVQEHLRYSALTRSQWIYYRFTDESGILHEGDSPYPFQEFGDLKNGSTVSVRYVKDAPDTNRALDYHRALLDTSLRDLLMIAFMLMLGGATLLYFNRLKSEE